MAESPVDRIVQEACLGRPVEAEDGSSAAPTGTTSESIDVAPTSETGGGDESPSGASFGSQARAVVIAALIGVPAFAFLVVITWGAILTPLAGLLLLSPFVAVNYLLWCRLLAPGKPAGRRPGVDGEVACPGPSGARADQGPARSAPLRRPDAGRRRRMMRSIGWIALGLASLVAAAWCLFAAAMTAALGSGPTTPELQERLRTSAHWLLAGSATSSAIALFALVRLVRTRRNEG